MLLEVMHWMFIRSVIGNCQSNKHLLLTARIQELHGTVDIVGKAGAWFEVRNLIFSTQRTFDILVVNIMWMRLNKI